MSIALMSRVWELPLTDSNKLVLLSLADNASDDGTCWPSIATIARRCSKSERTVQRAIVQLEAAGFVRRIERDGRSTQYVIRIEPAAGAENPRHGDTPVTVAPRQDDTPPPSPCHPTPVTVTPHPRHRDTQNHKEPSRNHQGNQKRARQRTPLAERPPDVSEEVWRDFLALRRDRRSPLSETALEGIRRQANSVDWTLEQALRECCERGWQGFKAAWIRENGNAGTRSGKPQRWSDRPSGWLA